MSSEEQKKLMKSLTEKERKELGQLFEAKRKELLLKELQPYIDAEVEKRVNEQFQGAVKNSFLPLIEKMEKIGREVTVAAIIVRSLRDEENRFESANLALATLDKIQNSLAKLIEKQNDKIGEFLQRLEDVVSTLEKITKKPTAGVV